MSSPEINDSNPCHNTNIIPDRLVELAVDMDQIADENKYGELLDELLSDDVDPSPKVELLDLEMEPSPTFQRFWASADDDEDDFYPQEDIANLSKLMDSLELQGRISDAENTMTPMMEYCKSNATLSDENACRLYTMQPSFSPSVKTSPIVLPRSASAPEPTCGRVPFGALDHHPESPDRKLDRRRSTGCTEDPNLKCPPINTVVLKSQDQNQEVTAEDENECLQGALDELEIQLSATATTASSQSTHMDNHKEATTPACTKKMEIQQFANVYCEGDSVPSSPEDLVNKKSTPNEPQDLTIETNPVSFEGGSVPPSLEHAVLKTSSEPQAFNVEIKLSASALREASILNTEKNSTGGDASCVSRNSDRSQAARDPFEWAYNVWKRKGLMAGTPTDQRRPASASDTTIGPLGVEISTVPSVDSSHTSKKSNAMEISATPSTDSSQISKESKGSQKSYRSKNSRKSLPARMSEHPHYYQPHKSKPRNCAGFSILLSKWKDKSDGNPNAHFLSPRELSPVKSPSNPFRNTSDANEQSCTASKDTTRSIPASIDTTPLLSPSKRREKLEREEASKLVVPKDIFGVSNAASAGTAPVVAPNRQRRRKSPDGVGLKQSQLQTKACREGLIPWPTPSKNKNALSRFLQSTKPTLTKSITVQSFGEKSKESFAKNKAKVHRTTETGTIAQKHPVLEISPVSARRGDGRSRRQSVSPTSTVRSFLSPGDDTLLEPRDVMRSHRRQRSDYTADSRNTSRTPVSVSVPCQEIFVIKDDQSSIGLQSDDLRSMAGESDFNPSVYSNADKMHFTNLPDIMETRVDSMSFDSQSQTTHITFRTETLKRLDNKVHEITQSKSAGVNEIKRTDLKSLNISEGEEDEDVNEDSPTRENLTAKTGGEMIGATPDYSERPWRKDLLYLNVTAAMEKASGSKQCDCEYSLAMFSEKDEMVDFFLPLMAVTCSCRKSKKLVNPQDPISLENILRPWQIMFLKAFGIVQGDQLVKAHHRSARSLAKSLYSWREKNSMATFRVGSCGMALQIWSNTSKAYVRSIRKQIAHGADPIERPNTLSVLSTFLENMPAQMHQNLPQRPSIEREVPESFEEI